MKYGVFLDRNSVDSGDMDFSSILTSMDNWQFHDSTSPSQVAAVIATATTVISNKVVVDAKSLSAASNLKLICIAATGTNNVDLGAANSRGITVCNVRDYATPSVTQHVFALLLSLSTNLKQYNNAVIAGDWFRSKHFCLLDFPIAEVAGKTMGIIGYGVLGRAIAQIALTFGMRVIVFTRTPQKAGELYAPLAQLLKTADVISLHCPLNQQTSGLIGYNELALMKPSSILINTARGGIVDEVALADALINGKIAGAGIDVLSKEPPDPDNALLKIKLPNLLVTPHIAWASKDSRQRLLNEVAKNIHDFFNGKPRNVVELDE